MAPIISATVIPSTEQSGPSTSVLAAPILDAPSEPTTSNTTTIIQSSVLSAPDHVLNISLAEFQPFATTVNLSARVTDVVVEPTVLRCHDSPPSMLPRAISSASFHPTYSPIADPVLEEDEITLVDESISNRTSFQVVLVFIFESYFIYMSENTCLL